jgi:hypothetical protein
MRRLGGFCCVQNFFNFFCFGLDFIGCKDHTAVRNMLIIRSNTCFRLIGAAALMLAVWGPTSALAETEAERIAALEARLAQLEARLDSQEQETKEVKVMAASGAAQSAQSGSSFTGNPLALDIMAGSAWRNLRWTQEEQWAGIRKGISEERVIELLGAPPRSLDSLKPRVDKVFWYETSLRDRSNALKGKISFKDGKVSAIKKPNFQAVKQAMQAR